MVIFAIYEITQSISRSKSEDEAGVSWAAHLGGAVTGLTLGILYITSI